MKWQIALYSCRSGETNLKCSFPILMNLLQIFILVIHLVLTYTVLYTSYFYDKQTESPFSRPCVTSDCLAAPLKCASWKPFNFNVRKCNICKYVNAVIYLFVCFLLIGLSILLQLYCCTWDLEFVINWFKNTNSALRLLINFHVVV